MRGDALGAEVPALERDIVASDGADHLQRLLEQRGPFVEIHTQRGELPLEVTDTDRQREPAVGGMSSVAPDFATTNGLRYGSDDVGDERSVVVRAAAKPIATNGSSASARRLQPPLRRGRMVGKPEPMKPGRFGRRNGRDAGAGDQLRVVGMAVHRMSDREPHLPSAFRNYLLQS